MQRGARIPFCGLMIDSRLSDPHKNDSNKKWPMKAYEEWRLSTHGLWPVPSLTTLLSYYRTKLISIFLFVNLLETMKETSWIDSFWSLMGLWVGFKLKWGCKLVTVYRRKWTNSQDSQEILLFLSENVLIKSSSSFQERLPLKKIKSLERGCLIYRNQKNHIYIQ